MSDHDYLLPAAAAERMAMQRDPYQFLLKAKAQGTARIKFKDASEAQRFYRQLRALNFGRGKDLGCYIRRDGIRVMATTLIEDLPKAELEP